jgi:hypothetical protein
MPKQAIAESYARLVTQIKNIITSGRKQIELTKAITYWKIGEGISRHLLSPTGRAGYGQGLYAKLSIDLKIGERTLQRAVQFHKEFPIPSARTELDWTHYRKLISIGDAPLRERLRKKAEKNNLTTRQLAKEIQKIQSIQSPQPLNPQKGPLAVYQIIASDLVKVPKGQVLIDQGFDCWTTIGHGDLTSVKFVNTRKEMAFTYKAYPQGIIDGDTFWAIIELGFGRYTRQKLRLRGIDAPEITTAAGKKAKEFTEKQLYGLGHIVVRSSKSDKYERYLADVFYGEQENFLNQDLIDAGLAVLWTAG